MPPVITMFSESGGRYANADPRVGSDTGVNVGLEQQQLQRIGVREAQQIQVHERRAASA